MIEELTNNDKLGIIAGSGNLVIEVIDDCLAKGRELVVVELITEDINPHNLTGNNKIICKKNDYGRVKSLQYLYPNLTIKSYYIGQVSSVIKFFKVEKVKGILFIGGVKKLPISYYLLKGKIDFRGYFFAYKIYKMLKNKIYGDNNVLTAILDNIESLDLPKILSIKEVVPLIMASRGILTKQKTLSASVKKNIDIAKKFLDHISKFDVGQALVIQHSNIIAFEGAEGTDRLIERSKDLILNKYKAPALLVKLKKKGQDERMDLPTIGINTIENMYKAGIKGLVVEAENTIILNKRHVLEKANQYDILIVGI